MGLEIELETVTGKVSPLPTGKLVHNLHFPDQDRAWWAQEHQVPHLYPEKSATIHACMGSVPCLLLPSRSAVVVLPPQPCLLQPIC